MMRCGAVALWGIRMNLKSSAIVAALCLVSSGVARAQDHASAPTVSVVGVASEDVRPDIAIVTLNVTDDRPNANDAASENARLTMAVVDGLKVSGVDAKDISTIGLSLIPVVVDQRDPKTNQIIKSVPNGFRASNVIRVRVREIDRAGGFISASVQNGALYQGLTFDLSDREARDDALRVKAVANAMHRASLYAEGASLKLGALRSIGAEGNSFQPMGQAYKAVNVAAAPLTIEPGLITLHEAVNATWEMTRP
jgi:uncharacterized protein YggE